MKIKASTVQYTPSVGSKSLQLRVARIQNSPTIQRTKPGQVRVGTPDWGTPPCSSDAAGTYLIAQATARRGAERAAETQQPWATDAQREGRSGALLRRWASRHHPRPELCEVCKETSTRTLHLDHCHRSGAFRGWLCHNCNLTLGMAKDSIPRLRALIAYLEAAA